MGTLYKTLQPIQYYNVFSKEKHTLDNDIIIGRMIASNIIIPKEDSTLEKDYANGLLDNTEYIELMISEGYIKEVS